MKFRIEYKALSECISSVSRAVSKTSNPIMQNIHVTVSENKVRFVGSDQTIMMISTAPAEVESTGMFTITAKTVQEIISSLPSEASDFVSFELIDEESGMLSISSLRSHFELQSFGTEEYPPIPVIENNESSVVLEKESILKAIKEASIAVNNDQQSPQNITKGICCDWVDPANPLLVSTDTKRLAVTEIKGIEIPEELRKNFVIPARAVPEISKLCESDDEVRMAMYGSQLLIFNSTDQFITRLLEGKFPEYGRIMPKESSHVIKVNRKDLTQAFKVVSPIARYINGQMIMLDIGATEMKIWAAAHENGLAEHFAPCSLEGEPINTAFNIKYLQDFVNVIEDEEVIIEMTTPGQPALLKTGNPESNYKYVVMPMHRPQ